MAIAAAAVVTAALVVVGVLYAFAAIAQETRVSSQATWKETFTGLSRRKLFGKHGSSVDNNNNNHKPTSPPATTTTIS